MGNRAFFLEMIWPILEFVTQPPYVTAIDQLQGESYIFNELARIAQIIYIIYINGGDAR